MRLETTGRALSQVLPQGAESWDDREVVVAIRDAADPGIFPVVDDSKASAVEPAAAERLGLLTASRPPPPPLLPPPQGVLIQLPGMPVAPSSPPPFAPAPSPVNTSLEGPKSGKAPPRWAVPPPSPSSPPPRVAALGQSMPNPGPPVSSADSSVPPLGVALLNASNVSSPPDQWERTLLPPVEMPQTKPDVAEACSCPTAATPKDSWQFLLGDDRSLSGGRKARSGGDAKLSVGAARQRAKPDADKKLKAAPKTWVWEGLES